MYFITVGFPELDNSYRSMSYSSAPHRNDDQLIAGIPQEQLLEGVSVKNIFDGIVLDEEQLDTMSSIGEDIGSGDEGSQEGSSGEYGGGGKLAGKTTKNLLCQTMRASQTQTRSLC